VVLLALAACGQADLPAGQPAAGATTVPQPTVLPPATALAPTSAAPSTGATPLLGGAGTSVRPPDALVAAAQQRLAKHLGVPANTLMLQSANRQEWPDGALGCPQANQVYPQVVTPGFLLVFSNAAQSQTYAVHVGRSEQQMTLCENNQPIDLADQTDSVTPTPAADTQQPSAASRPLVDLARQALAKELGIGADQVTVRSIEAAEWRNSSLGCPKPGMNYLQVLTSGYKIILEAQGRSYEYHTDSEKRVVRCDTPASDATAGLPAAGAALANTAWKLEAFGDSGNPQPIIAGSEITLVFGGSKPTIGGRSGCNSYGGKYAIDGTKISFTEIVSTLMACESQPLMEQEAQFQQALRGVERYQITGDQLELIYDGAKVLRLRTTGQ
jgi:heat shock protein HslJ